MNFIFVNANEAIHACMKQNTWAAMACDVTGVKWSGCQVCQWVPLINMFLQPSMSVRHYQLPWADHLDLHLGVSGGGVGAAQVCTRPSYMSVCAGRGVRSVPNTAEMDGGQWRSRAWWWRIWQAWLHSLCLGQNQLPLQAIHQNVARSQIFQFYRERETILLHKKILVLTARVFFACTRVWSLE